MNPAIAPDSEFMDRLLLKDARLLTAVLPTTDPCVDVTITSPPYWNLKDYRASDQIGYGQTKSEYLADMRKVLRDCFLVTKRTGSLWLVVDTYRQEKEVQLLPFELAEQARRVGWKLRDLIVWDKQQSVPWQAGGQLRNTSEFILFMSKSDSYKYYVDHIKTLDGLSKWWVDFPERFNPKGKTPTNIWSIPMRPRGKWRRASKNDHYCSFPTALVARIIELTTVAGDLVMDPFAGSGVVLAQAASMERHYIGFEVNKGYVQMFEDTVKAEVAIEWKELKAWRRSQEDARVDFEQTIMKLRALKYARQVTRPFLEAITPEQRAQIQAILCLASIPEEYRHGYPFRVKILVVVDKSLPEFGSALEAAKSRAARPPLTQYGIRSVIQMTRYLDLQSQTELASSTLYLYPKYKPRQHVASGLLKEWFEEGLLKKLAEDHKVPMLANVAVDVAWALKE
jgi:DNA modification methylase